MKLIIFLLVLFLTSCAGSGNNVEQNNSKNDTIHNERENIIHNDLNQESDIPEGWIQVEMNAITFLFEKIDMSWGTTNSDDEQRCSFQDTAFFDLWPGDWMEDKIIKVKGDKFEITGMFVQEVTAIGVDSERIIEVPYCVLAGWKKSTSSWLPVEPTNNVFRFKTDNSFDAPPLNIEIDELKMAIKNACGKEWFEEYRNADSLNQIPFSETTIQYNYKIVSRESQSGKTFESIVVFFTPTSC